MRQNKFIISYYAPLQASVCFAPVTPFFPFTRFDGFLSCLFYFSRIKLNLYPGAELKTYGML